MEDPIVEEIIEVVSHRMAPIEPVIVHTADPSTINMIMEENPHEVLMVVTQPDYVEEQNTDDNFHDVFVDKEVDLERGVVKIKRSTYIKEDYFTDVRNYVYERPLNMEKDMAAIERARVGKPAIPKILHSASDTAYIIEYPDDYDYKNDADYQHVCNERKRKRDDEFKASEYFSDFDSEEFSDDSMDIEDEMVAEFVELTEKQNFFSAFEWGGE